MSRRKTREAATAASTRDTGQTSRCERVITSWTWTVTLDLIERSDDRDDADGVECVAVVSARIPGDGQPRRNERMIFPASRHSALVRALDESVTMLPDFITDRVADDDEEVTS